jgi:hypothetical protein
MTKDITTVEEGQIVESAPTAVSSPQAVMLTPKQLESQLKRDTQMREIIKTYINNNMVDGKDYGSIVVKGVKSKPSLFKPGSEKFCGLFKIRATFRKDSETVDMLGNTPGIIAYVCELIDTRGRVVGEGRGIYKISTTDTDFNINKAVKIAEKRAQIDAVLRTGGLSDFFTQDLEDAPKDFGGSAPAASAPQASTTEPASDRQVSFARDLLKRAGYNDEAISKRLMELNSKADAKQLIDKLLNQGTTQEGGK